MRGSREPSDGFAELVSEQGRGWVAAASVVIGDASRAEEVVQEAFISIWQNAASYDPGLGSARGWIYAIVRHRALNVIRDGAREDLLDPEAMSAKAEGDTIIDDAFEQLATSSRLRACLEAIEQEKRESLLLSYVAGYSHGEIAGRLGVPVGTAKSWVRRGLAALKECMA